MYASPAVGAEAAAICVGCAALRRRWSSKPPLHAPDGMRLDDTDIKLLQLLHGNARAQNSALAESVNLSASACLQRQRRLEGAGAIRRYTTDLDEDLFRDWSVVWVSIVLLPGAQRPAFESMLGACARVLEAHELAGRFDYFLKVALGSVSVWPEVRAEIDPGDVFIRSVDVLGGIRTVKIASLHPLLRNDD